MTGEPGASDGSVDFFQALRSIAAPVYPIKSMTNSEHRFDWITAHETYKTWFQSSTPSILHIYGPKDTSEASDSIFRVLDVHRKAENSKEILTYFAFERYDDRYRSVTAMLNTIFAQIFSQQKGLYAAVRVQLKEMYRYSSWTQTELLLLFQILLSRNDHGGILCVINRMDECDESRMAFLEDICNFAMQTERRFKIVIASTADYDLQSALTDWPTINLDDHRKDSLIIDSTLASDVDLEVLELMQQRPEYHDFQSIITEKIRTCGQQTHWRRLVLDRLRFCEISSTTSQIQRQLDVLPPTSYREVLIRTLTGVPVERQQWARRVLVWALYTFRSLSVSELGVALMFQDQSSSNLVRFFDVLVYRDIINELNEVFKGIFIVKGNEVHFSSTNAREFLLKVGHGHKTAWYDVNETAHQEITEVCFSYLSLSQVQKSIAASYIYPPADLLESPTYLPQYSFCSYALKYWPHHYKHIARIIRPTRSALDFCRTVKAFRLWAQAYWAVWKPMSQTDRVFLSILPTLAGLGLQDLVTEWLYSEFELSQNMSHAAALIEAARNAEVEVVGKLLPIGEYSQSDFEDAFIAASSCCDEANLDLLIAHVAKHSENILWPPALLCRAAQFGLEKVVRTLLKLGAPLEAAATRQNLTPLHLAARHGQAEIASVLLESGASLQELAEYNMTPLHLASLYGHINVLVLMLDAGANCNAVEIDKYTALDIACDRGSHTVVRTLLTKSECDTGSDERGHWTPLSVASMRGFLSCAQFLLEKGAKTEVLKTQDPTPLHLAAVNGHIELCKLLLQYGADPNDSFDGNPILSFVLGESKFEVVKLLIDHGVDINATNGRNRTALLEASKIGHKDLVAYLIEHGANLYHEDNDGWTSVHYAALSGYTEVLQLLYTAGADLQRPTPDGWTPLHLCSESPETANFLLKNGADVSSVTNDLGSTPLIVAITSKNPEVVKILLEAGSNIDHQIKNGTICPLQYAVYYNHEEIFRILMEYNPQVDLVDDDGDTALNFIDSDTPLGIAKILLNRGADPSIRNKEQETPLYTAVRLQNYEIVKYLVKKAGLDILGARYGGPLHIACYQSNLDIIKILVDAGADANLADPFVSTPLYSACICEDGQTKEQESVIFYLINEVNVDIDIVGGLQGCAINAACGRSSFEVVRLMLEKGAKIDVRDDMGRMAIHFAAARSMENFQAIFESGGDVEMADEMGRTALHWASVGGKVDVVNQIIALSKGLVERADRDGWTPLLWAARGSDTAQAKVSSSAQEEVIKLLLDRGADPCVKAKGLDRTWSPVKVARYHGVDTRVIRLLEEKAKEKLSATGSEDVWDEGSHESRKAVPASTAWCDSCLSVGTFSWISPDPHLSPILLSLLVTILG